MTDAPISLFQLNSKEIPKAEFARVLGASLKLSVVADGKTHLFRLSKYHLLCLMESGFEALKELEPDSEIG